MKDRPIYQLECPGCRGAVDATFPVPHIHNEADLISVCLALPSVECQHCHQYQFKLVFSGTAMAGPAKELFVCQTAWIAGPVDSKLVTAKSLPSSLLT